MKVFISIDENSIPDKGVLAFKDYEGGLDLADLANNPKIQKLIESVMVDVEMFGENFYMKKKVRLVDLGKVR